MLRSATLRPTGQAHAIALFVTNVHGPSERFAVAGAPLTQAWPLPVVVERVLAEPGPATGEDQ